MTFTKVEFSFYYTHKYFSTLILIKLCLGYDIYDGGFKNIEPSYFQAHVKSLSPPDAEFDKIL